LTSAGNVWAITFGGSLANLPAPLLTVLLQSGETPTVDLALAGGASGTYVANGATLQLESSDASGKALTLVGNGFNNLGALENVSGNNTWDAGTLTAPIYLAGNPNGLAGNPSGSASIGADGTSTLTIDQPITDNSQTPALQLTGFTAPMAAPSRATLPSPAPPPTSRRSRAPSPRCLRSPRCSPARRSPPPAGRAAPSPSSPPTTSLRAKA
jgi:hypothetical protein